MTGGGTPGSLKPTDRDATGTAACRPRAALIAAIIRASMSARFPGASLRGSRGLCSLFPTASVLIAVLVVPLSASDTPIPPVPRSFFGARLELPGVLHGGGQDPKGFANYVCVVGANRPILYKLYYNLGNDLERTLVPRVAQLNAHARKFGEFLIPEIGLSMVNEKDRRPFEDEVARGTYDQKLEQFCQALRRLGRPAFVRIGFEFNGPWNNYRPAF